MNKKIVFSFLALLIMLNSVNALHFNLNWIEPLTEPHVLEEGMDLNVQMHIECIKDGADPRGSTCQDVNATLYYCLLNGDVCGNSPVLIEQTGNLHLVEPTATAKIILGKIVPVISDSTIGWQIAWPDAIPGQRYNIIVAVDSNNTPDINMDKNLWIASVNTSSLAGDSEEPFIDAVNDEKTELIINVLLPGDVLYCKYYDMPEGNGQRCDDTDIDSHPDYFVCDLKNLASYPESLTEGSYTYYYRCMLDSQESGPTVNPFSEFRQIDFTVEFPQGINAEITQPLEGQKFVIGNQIDFRALISESGFQYAEWTSSKDSDWKKTQENFFSDELSIGSHKITLTALFESGGIPTEITDSVNIQVIPIPVDVFNIISFEINNSTNPGKKITTEDSIEVTAIIKNETNNDECSYSELTILNAETGETVYYLEDDLFDECPVTLVPANGVLEKTYLIDLSSEGITKENYKVKFDVKEIYKEQNKENNHKTEIISVFDPVKEMTATEMSVLIIPAILLSTLLILKKNQIKEFINKRKQAKTNKKNN